MSEGVPTAGALAPDAAGTLAPDAVAPPPGHPRFPLLDSLRGIALLGPVIGHAAYLGGAVRATFTGGLIANTSIAPTIFFILSSFLLYRPFVAGRLLGARAPTFAEYGWRRLLRIVPAYWVILTALAIYPGLPGVFSRNWWQYYGFLQIYTGAGGGIVSAWTVCIEVSFYLALPLYVIFIRRLTRGLAPERAVHRELIVLAALGLGSAGLRALDLEVLGTRLQLSLLETFLWFSIGLAMAVLSVADAHGGASGRPRALRVLRGAARHPLLCWAGAVASYVVLALVLVNPTGQLRYSSTQWVAYHFLSALIAVLLFIPAAFAQERRSLPQRVLRMRVFAFIGVISYSVYLWQGGVVQTLYNHGVSSAASLVLATLGVSVVLGASSYYLLERPVLRLKTRGFYWVRTAGATTRAAR